MAGGRGERFWPQSRLRRPKHLLPIVGDTPMLSQTLDRLEGLVTPQNTLIITNAQQRDAVLEVCPQLPPENIVGEPVGRDTAAAVGLAMVLVQSRNPNGVIAMLPADATIHDHVGFRRCLGAAYSAARAEPCLVTIGIEPSYAATGYGYIHKGDAWKDFDGLQSCRVAKFVEKPDAPTAETYLASGDYYWNAGMFVFSVAAIADCFAAYTPELNASLEHMRQTLEGSSDLDGILQAHYPKLEKISVDYAIMEPASTDGKIVCVPSCFDWDDVGEWPAVARHCETDASGNVVRGQAHLSSANGNIVVTEPGHTVAMLGVSDLIVVQTPDATLICPKDQAQNIKGLVRSIGATESGKALM